MKINRISILELDELVGNAEPSKQCVSRPVVLYVTVLLCEKSMPPLELLSLHDND